MSEMEQILKTCPDCGVEYIGAPDDNCCAKCFDEFIEELCSVPSALMMRK